MTISAGDWTVFFTRPLSATILLLAALALFGPDFTGWLCAGSARRSSEQRHGGALRARGRTTPNER